MDLGLAGKVAIVTGASKGIGLAIVRGLVANGANVIAAARASSAGLEDMAKAGQAQIARLDLTDPAAPARLVDLAGDRIDILVNNVGNAPARPGGFLTISDADWLSTITVNFMAAVRATRAVVPTMIAAGHGVIVNTSSVNSYLPDPAVMDYCAAKAALANFAKALSKEVGPHGIRVNCVSPGPVATDLWLGTGGVAATVSAATGADPEYVASQAASQMVTGRFTTPAEVADLVLFLASDRAANVTGADYAIDGGLVQTL
jgi:NAD(P)-dependent dehydrogenase (short-subunit alcohol dehydrogenase family)